MTSHGKESEAMCIQEILKSACAAVQSNWGLHLSFFRFKKGHIICIKREDSEQIVWMCRLI